jgi:hypothetical protein
VVEAALRDGDSATVVVDIPILGRVKVWSAKKGKEIGDVEGLSIG